MNDIETLKEHVSTDVYARVFANRHLCALLADGAYLVSFRFCDITDPMQKDEHVVAWCAGENLLFYTDCRRCRDLIEATDENAAALRAASRLKNWLADALATEVLHDLDG